mmetsp:Transcript_13786/g.18856  ORF Transcript_13786/g.18856 Transcript_13786/m.18856 type:complete len:86 (+) Transcript_13786:435-692(+)
MLIAHTQQHVVLPSKPIGEEVNIEVDVLAKMVENSLTGATEGWKKQWEMAHDENKLLTEKLQWLTAKVEEMSATIARMEGTTKHP